MSDMTTTPIAQALRRLAASDTPRKRRNALLAFNRAVRELQVAVTEQYRPMRKDGSFILLVKRRGRLCPICKLPMRSVGALLTHLLKYHGWKNWNCTCGLSCNSRHALVCHLGAVKDLGVHFARAAIMQSAGRI